jgi:hypothetical protein
LQAHMGWYIIDLKRSWQADFQSSLMHLTDGVCVQVAPHEL